MYFILNWNGDMSAGAELIINKITPLSTNFPWCPSWLGLRLSSLQCAPNACCRVFAFYMCLESCTVRPGSNCSKSVYINTLPPCRQVANGLQTAEERGTGVRREGGWALPLTFSASGSLVFPNTQWPLVHFPSP